MEFLIALSAASALLALYENYRAPVLTDPAPQWWRDVMDTSWELDERPKPRAADFAGVRR